MAEEYEEQMGDESSMTGPGAPTPINALEVSLMKPPRGEKFYALQVPNRNSVERVSRVSRSVISN